MSKYPIPTAYLVLAESFRAGEEEAAHRIALGLHAAGFRLVVFETETGRGAASGFMPRNGKILVVNAASLAEPDALAALGVAGIIQGTRAIFPTKDRDSAPPAFETFRGALIRVTQRDTADHG